MKKTTLRGGWRDPDLAVDLPDLAVHERTCAGPSTAPSSRRAARERLRELSDRFDGAHLTTLHLEPVPGAYRALARQLGLDPDADGMPGDELLRERLRRGEFRSHGVVEDALAIALLETGVPVWALPAAEVDGPLGMRAARPGETVAGGDAVDAGRLVIADAVRPLALVLHEPALAPEGELVLFALRVAAVPTIMVDEALWTAAQILAPPGG